MPAQGYRPRRPGPADLGRRFHLMKPTMGAFPPLLFIALVYAIIALAVTPLAPRSRTPFGWMMLIAALGGSVQSCLLALGLSMLPASTSTLLLQLTVPFAILMSWIARIDRRACATASAAPWRWRRRHRHRRAGREQSLVGIVLIAIASFAWSMAQILIRLRCSDSGATFYAAMARHAWPQALIASLLLEHDHLGWLARASTCGLDRPRRHRPHRLRRRLHPLVPPAGAHAHRSAAALHAADAADRRGDRRARRSMNPLRSSLMPAAASFCRPGRHRLADATRGRCPEVALGLE